jgi:hypothetical protein
VPLKPVPAHSGIQQTELNNDMRETRATLFPPPENSLKEAVEFFLAECEGGRGGEGISWAIVGPSTKPKKMR